MDVEPVVSEPHHFPQRHPMAHRNLEEVPDAPPPPPYPVGNVRVMVPDVDNYWALAQKIGAQVLRPLENRSYGLRDFTIAGPDGLGLRFATRL